LTFEQDLNKWCLESQNKIESLRLDIAEVKGDIKTLKNTNKVLLTILGTNAVLLAALIGVVFLH